MDGDGERKEVDELMEDYMLEINISVKIYVIFTIKEAFKPSKRD